MLAGIWVRNGGSTSRPGWSAMGAPFGHAKRRTGRPLDKTWSQCP